MTGKAESQAPYLKSLGATEVRTFYIKAAFSIQYTIGMAFFPDFILNFLILSIKIAVK